MREIAAQIRKILVRIFGSLGRKGGLQMTKLASAVFLVAAIKRGPCADQYRRTESRSKPSVHDDAGGDVQPALAHRVPARWTHAHHREGRPGLAGHPAGRQDRSGTCRPLTRARAACWACFVSPHYATDHNVYLTYSEPGEYGGSSLALGAGKLSWRRALGGQPRGTPGAVARLPEGPGGQFGAQIAFSPDGEYLFLTVGDRQRMTPARIRTALGKILRLTLDGKPAPGNPKAGKVGDRRRSDRIRRATRRWPRPRRSSAPIRFRDRTLTPAETWTTGLRTPYGLAFAPDGRLWELEHGPRGGDELNLTPRCPRTPDHPHPAAPLLERHWA